MGLEVKVLRYGLDRPIYGVGGYGSTLRCAGERGWLSLLKNDPEHRSDGKGLAKHFDTSSSSPPNITLSTYLTILAATIRQGAP